MDWAAEQPAWVNDSLRRITLAADHSVSDDDLACILDNVRAAASGLDSKHVLTPIEESHFGIRSAGTQRTVLAQLGPVQNIDRLARGQKLRLAPNGITLVYGENGSGKSGYTRIAKRLCRSLSADDLRNNVFAPSSVPMRVEVRYRAGEGEVTTLDWDPSEAAPSQLRQISVFDSHNARLYVDSENRIAYLPRELAILEHHGELCTKMAAKFAVEEKTLGLRLRTALPAGYTPGTKTSHALDKLTPKATHLPSTDEFRALAKLSDWELKELERLNAALRTDPIAQAATRRRAIALLRRVSDILAKLQVDLSNSVGTQIATARRELRETCDAERLVAKNNFIDEPIDNVGGAEWRILFEAARAFAVSGTDERPERLPEAVGDLCLLCLEPLTPPGAARLARFNDFVCCEAAKRAERAREALKVILQQIEEVNVPEIAVVEENLASYGDLDPARALIVSDILQALTGFKLWRTALLEDDPQAAACPPDVTVLATTVSNQISTLQREAEALQESASHTDALDATRMRLSELKDRVKLSNDLETVLQRHHDITEYQKLSLCTKQVATRPISTQISKLRKLLVTEELERRISEEITAFDLSHLPLKVNDSSSGGKSLFSVGLQGAGVIKNNKILSEGEQRALALACFLAEIGGDDAQHGIIVDDPVSSLDHLRMRKVAHRLVAEAAKGKQVIIFTHNIVFFNEVVSEAARAGDSAPLIKSVISKTEADGFGVIHENKEPWVADLNSRIVALRERAKMLSHITEFDTDEYRRKVKDFYSDLRESWERAVEEIVLAKTVVRFVPDVMTGRLKEVSVTDEDYSTIFFAMKRASERSGHDMAAGRDIPLPSPDEMEVDIRELDEFRTAYKRRSKETSASRSALEKPTSATLI
ncbi:AAA family ATPase [Aurantimonas coralicida]|uniref:AAA family ATPase n=1 Tax=Aurantimonas coralicida TaxID=182270 RepID=UPI001D18400F|nr:AAA family ATPase [Aurantimonas coralicida]MCC4300299.1 AAA family ATPase [Aurantimonas coralicida]